MCITTYLAGFRKLCILATALLLGMATSHAQTTLNWQLDPQLPVLLTSRYRYLLTSSVRLDPQMYLLSCMQHLLTS